MIHQTLMFSLVIHSKILKRELKIHSKRTSEQLQQFLCSWGEAHGRKGINFHTLDVIVLKIFALVFCWFADAWPYAFLRCIALKQSSIVKNSYRCLVTTFEGKSYHIVWNMHLRINLHSSWDIIIKWWHRSSFIQSKTMVNNDSNCRQKLEWMQYLHFTSTTKKTTQSNIISFCTAPYICSWKQQNPLLDVMCKELLWRV
jgi:hypothetical protein